MKKRNLTKVLAIMFFVVTCVFTMVLSVQAQIKVDGVRKNSPATVNGSSYVSADANGDELTVDGDINNNIDRNAVDGNNKATIIVNSDITNKGSKNAISAKRGSKITVKGNINALDDNQFAITATDNDTVVLVDGSVNSKSILTLEHATIKSANGAVVKTSGDTKNTNGDNVIETLQNGVALVEGTVTGKVVPFSANANVYLGQLDGSILTNLNTVHYLVGFAKESASDVTIVNNDLYDPDKIVTGVTEKEYFYTNTANIDELTGKSISLKSSINNAKLLVSNIPKGVTTSEKDGVITLTLTEGFKGGLQNIMLTLEGEGIAPKTVDNIFTYIIIGIISLVGVMLSGIYIIRRKKIS